MRIKDSLSIYNTLVNSYLNYGLMAWGGMIKVYPSFFKRLVILPKKCIRNACHVGYNAHTTPLCFKFKIIKLEDIYNVQIVTHYYNYFHKLLPENLNCANLFPINRDLHTYSTRQDSFIRSYGICRARMLYLQIIAIFFLKLLMHFLVILDTILNIFPNKILFFVSRNII